MDNTIKSMFEEKNMKILINKLILDIDNNSNSLELTIKLKIPHLKYKLIKKLSKLYNEEGVDYTVSELTELLDERETYIKDAIFPLLDERRDSLSSGVKESTVVDPSMVSGLINEASASFKEKFNVSMNKEIYIELYKVLSEKYQLKNEDSKEKFDSILSAYDSDVENIIIGEVTERDKTLLNQTEDTFSQYHKLNEFNESYSDKEIPKIKSPKVKETT